MSESETQTNPSSEAGRRSWTNLFLGLHLSAGVLFLTVLNVLSLAASRDWALDLLTHFRFQYTLLFLVAGVSLLLLRWKRMAAVALVGLVFNGWFLAPLYLPNAQTRAAADLPDDPAAPRLRILHVNVNTANPRRQDVGKMIRESGADVVFLQEISPAWVAALDGQTGRHKPALLDPRTDNFGIGVWVHAGGAVGVVSAKLVDLSGGLAQVNAIDMVLDFDEGQQVRVVSLHTLPPVSGAYAAARDAQLAGAARLATETDGPFVLIGDLNATPWSARYRRLVRDGGLTDSLAGRGRGDLRRLAGPGASWPAGLVTPGMIPIDHCLTRGGLIVTERRLRDATGSDHRPLFVEMIFSD